MKRLVLILIVICSVQFVHEARAMSNAQLAGGIVGTFVGFGLGHAVQGRFFWRGALMFAGEAGGIALVYYGLFREVDSGLTDNTGRYLMYGGLATMLLFHIWEIYDVWTYGGSSASLDAPENNQKYAVAPLILNNGGGLNFAMRF